jgi:hypothetical protein
MTQNRSGELANVDLYYDWVEARNLNIITPLSGSPLFDNERGNGSTYYYHKHNTSSCNVIEMGVGILRPDWLQGADFLGQEEVRTVHGMVLAQVFAKDGAGHNPFITYYHNPLTDSPVRWVFFDNASFDVLEWEKGGKPKDESVWTIPDFCFT